MSCTPGAQESSSEGKEDVVGDLGEDGGIYTMTDQEDEGAGCLIYNARHCPRISTNLDKGPQVLGGGCGTGGVGVGDEDLEPSSNRTAYCGCLLLPPLTGWGLRCMSGHA